MMCEFLSWIEKGDKIYFLTRKQIDSPKGKMLKMRFPGDGKLVGHAAIRAYYDIDDGLEHECTNFATPTNFPDKIVNAIKRGDFRGLATPEQLLSKPALAEYEKIEQQAFWDLFAILKNRASQWSTKQNNHLPAPIQRLRK